MDFITRSGRAYGPGGDYSGDDQSFYSEIVQNVQNEVCTTRSGKKYGPVKYNARVGSKRKVEDVRNQNSCQKTPKRIRFKKGTVHWQKFIAVSLRKPKAQPLKPQKPNEGFGLCPYCQEAEPPSLGPFRIVRMECEHHCVFCQFWHKYPSGLLEHKQKEHALRCDQCKLIFSTEDESTVHFHEQHQPFHECVPCRRFFAHPRLFSVHTKSAMHLNMVNGMQRTWLAVKRKFDIASPDNTENDTKITRFEHAKRVPKVLKAGRHCGSHMKLDRFLDALQKEHNAQLIRIDQLENGQAPKPQNPIYAQLNVRINRYRDDLREWLEVNRNAANRDKEAYIMGYMRRMQYLLAGQTPPQAD